MRKIGRPDKQLIVILGVLLVYGFFIFTSASLGLLAREGASFSSVMFSQVTGLIVGLGVAFGVSRIQSQTLRSASFWIYAVAVIATLCVFIPGIGFGHGGAKRWIDIGFTTVQPGEFLKIAYILFLGAYLTTIRKRIHDWRVGIVTYGIITAIPAIALYLQPDNDTLAVIAVSGMAMLIAVGMRWKHVLVLCGVGVLVAGIAYASFPYVRDRVATFLNPESNSQGAGYQIQQSLIAIGSGEFSGKGFGKSVQKFHYLPEPIGDSIFAVAGEEFGFLGSVFLIALFILFALRAYAVSALASDPYSMVIGVGATTLITVQAFINIFAMLGIIPISGLTLPFVSHGGTALIVMLFSAGIILGVSRKSRV